MEGEKKMDWITQKAKQDECLVHELKEASFFTQARMHSGWHIKGWLLNGQNDVKYPRACQSQCCWAAQGIFINFIWGSPSYRVFEVNTLSYDASWYLLETSQTLKGSPYLVYSNMLTIIKARHHPFEINIVPY